jgi:Heterokaryon incompatibility protein (HET)
MAYVRLNSNCIRILRVRSRLFSVKAPSAHHSQDAPIHCDLYTVEREDKPDYDALSYFWGDAQVKLPVLVNYTNGEGAYVEKQVTENLFLALEHFREDTIDIIIWADALCINQEDEMEKGEQVKQMRSVYDSARRTRVWLGPKQSNSDQALIRFTEIGEKVVQNGGFDAMIKMNDHGNQFSDESYKAEVLVTERIGDMLKNAATDQHESFHLLNELVHLLSKPYWKRVWILQEIVVSREIDVFCGKSKIDFTLLHAAVLYMIYMQVYVCKDLFEKFNAALDVAASKSGVDNLDNDSDLFSKFNQIKGVVIPTSAQLVFGMRQGHRSHGEQSGQTSVLDLKRLLAQIRVGREVTDAKDRVYALLGMLGDTAKLGIIPNYDESYLCSRLYCETAAAIIVSGDVDLLSFAQPNTKQDGVPSWVPDWRNEVMEPCGLLPWLTSYYAAGDTDQGKFEKHLKFDSVTYEHLTLGGYTVDYIESLKDQCNKGEYLGLTNREAAWKYLRDIQLLCEESNKKLSQIYSNASLRTFAPAIVPIAGMVAGGFFRMVSIAECVHGWQQVIKDYQGWAEGTPPPEKPIEMQNYYNGMARQVSRRPFITTQGFVGLAPFHAQQGDIVVIFQGAKFPYTLRKCGSGKYKLIGDTYLHGVMYGEFIKSDMDLEEFCLE